MKAYLTIILSLMCISISFADLIPLSGYDKTKPPGLSLPAAYECAMSALGSETNEYHCLDAKITTLFSSEGEWYFTFYSTNASATPKLIAVEFNGKVVFDHGAH